LLEHNRPQVLALLESGLAGGAQVSELTDQLLVYFRDLMVLASGAGQATLLSIDEQHRAALAKQAAAAGLQTVLAALQILAESKNKMKGAAYSRVLLEMALVRIATLEALDGLAEIVAQLRQGPAAGVAAAPSVARTTQPAPVRKEKDVGTAIAQQGASSEMASGLVSADSASDQSRPESGHAVNSAPPMGFQTIPFEVGRETEIWSQVMALLSDMPKSNAKNVAATAISGPNALVLTFPKSYHLSKQYFERSPEQLTKVERAIERVVGKPIRVSLAVDESAVEERKPVRDTAADSQVDRKAIDGSNDRLVQRAMAVFGATIVKVETEAART